METTTLSGDGLKIRDVGASSGKKLYINLCSSVVIEEPTDKNGKPIVGTRNVADGLSIPLIVGPVRGQEATSNENSKELYVDVVLHPRVIELANSEKYFKAQIVDLALDWVIKESKVECDRKWSHVSPAIYKGGRGENRGTPVLFFVDANGAPVPMTPVDSSTSAAPKSSVLSSTSSLLSQLNKEKSTESAHVAENLDVLNTKPFVAGTNLAATAVPKADSKATDSKPAKPLIQEIGSPSASLVEDEKPLQVQGALFLFPCWLLYLLSSIVHTNRRTNQRAQKVLPSKKQLLVRSNPTIHLSPSPPHHPPLRYPNLQQLQRPVLRWQANPPPVQYRQLLQAQPTLQRHRH